MTYAIFAKRILLETKEINNQYVIIKDGKIAEITKDLPKGIDEILRFENEILSPGFIDVHIHGANGYDVMDAKPEAIQEIANYLATTGTTGFLATTVTGSKENTLEAIRAVQQTQQMATAKGAKILGVHLEGPFLNEKKKGAQNGAFIRRPSIEELKEYADTLKENFKLITLAPELDKDFQTIKFARECGAVVSAGHSCASYETALASFDAGVTHATHLFNGMEPLHHRKPGLVGAALSDSRVHAEIIADTIHLHPGIIEFILMTKGIERSVFVTDCMRAGNLPDGDYELGGLAVKVTEGVARLAEGNLAGSTLRMIDAIKNTLTHAKEEKNRILWRIVQPASINPAKELGLEKQKGSITVGKDADLTIFDEEYVIKMTIVEGKIVYRN